MAIDRTISPKAEAPKKGRPPALKPDARTLAIVRGLASIQATQREAAAVLKVHPETLNAFVKEGGPGHEDWVQGRQEGLVSLRRSQFRLAEKNAAMAIWLGKQLLGQTDKHEFEHSGSIEIASDARVRLADLLGRSDNDTTDEPEAPALLDGLRRLGD